MNVVHKVENGYVFGETYLYDTPSCAITDRAQFVVLYHRGCADGVGAAWAIHHWLRTNNDTNAQAVFIGVQYDTLEKDLSLLCDSGLLSGANVYVVDFSINAGDCHKIHQHGALGIDIYDHHKTAEETIKDLRSKHGFTYVDVVFDMSQSGAAITWQELFPCIPMPDAIKHIQDRDLWKFEYPATRAFSSGLFGAGLTFETLDTTLTNDGLEKLLSAGEAVEQAKLVNVNQSLGRDLYSTDTVVAFNGKSYHIGMVNVPFYLASDTAHELLDRHPELTFAIAYFIKGDGTVSCSCRSRGDFDVSAFAKTMGGGGHAAAAGFTIPVDQFYDWFLGVN